jgi:hypothetical protein
MSNYERDSTMVGCIIATIILCALLIGGLAYFSSIPAQPTTPNNGWELQDYTTFIFEHVENEMPEMVKLRIRKNSGGVNIKFAQNHSLLYRIEMLVHKDTVESIGPPNVTYTGDYINLNYEHGATDIVLGTGTIYEFDIRINSGGIDADLRGPSRVGDLSLSTNSGGIEFKMNSQIMLYGNATFELETESGGMDIDTSLPLGVGGCFQPIVDSGEIDISSNWGVVINSVYYTTSYETASQTVTITAEVESGVISASLG